MPHPPRRARLAVRALAGLSIVAAALAPATTAARAAAATQPDATTIAARQPPLLEVANQITQLTRKGAAPRYSGYGDIDLSIPDNVVNLYWHGPVPAGVHDLLRRTNATAHVNVIPAPYTWQQLQVQTHRLQAHRSDLAARGIMLTRIATSPGATGLDVGVDYATSPTLRAPTGAPATAASDARATVQDTMGPGTPPVSISNVPPVTPAGSRDHDNSPWWGGSRISRAGYVCSTAFAVTINGANYLLTAAHCGGINTYWDVTDWYHGGPGDSLYLGTETNRIPADDTAIIRVNNTQPDIYDKGWNSSTAYEWVLGAVDTYRNSWICTEGATSGARCAGQVYFADGTTYIDGLGWLNHESGASSSAHLTAGGDSGGPVIVNSPYPGDVYATGTITGYENTAACPSNIDPYISPVCSHDVVYETIYNVLADWGASMK